MAMIKVPLRAKINIKNCSHVLLFQQIRKCYTFILSMFKERREFFIFRERGNTSRGE